MEGDEEKLSCPNINKNEEGDESPQLEANISENHDSTDSSTVKKLPEIEKSKESNRKKGD